MAARDLRAGHGGDDSPPRPVPEFPWSGAPPFLATRLLAL